MKNPIRKEVKLPLGGKERTLVYSFEAMATAEEILDRPLVTGLRRRDIATPTINLVRAMLFGCLLTDEPELKYEEVKPLVTASNLSDVWLKVIEAWGAAQPGGDPEESRP